MASSDVDEDGHSTYSMSTQKRGLLRQHIARPVFRNLPLFIFLAGLVLFFYILHIYKAQSDELILIREEMDLENLAQQNARKELIELEVEMESNSLSYIKLKKKLDATNKDVEEYSSQLRTANENIKSLNAYKDKLVAEKTKCLNDVKALKNELIALKNQKKNAAASVDKVVTNKDVEAIKKQQKTKNESDLLQKTAVISPENKTQEAKSSQGIPESKKAEENLSDLVNKSPTEVAGRMLNKPDNENVLLPPPNLAVGQSLSHDVGNIDAPNPQALPKLEEVLGMKAAEKNVDTKMRRNAAEPQIVGGAYVDKKDAANSIPDEAAPDFENDEKRFKEPNV